MKWTLTLDGETVFSNMAQDWYAENVSALYYELMSFGWDWGNPATLIELHSHRSDYRVRIDSLKHHEEDDETAESFDLVLEVSYKGEGVYGCGDFATAFRAVNLRAGEWTRNGREISNPDGTIKIVPSTYGGGHVDVLHLVEGRYFREMLCHNDLGWENWWYLRDRYLGCQSFESKPLMWSKLDRPSGPVPPMPVYWGRNENGELCRVDGSKVVRRNPVHFDLQAASGTYHHKFAMADQSDDEVVMWAERLLPALD